MNFSNVDTYVNTLDSIEVQVNATHLNYVNGNALLYTTDAAKCGGISWLKPYNKPQLLYHDKHSDPIGRVSAFELKDTAENLDEPQDFIKLTVNITDKDAMAKVMKGLYYTCSVGSTATSVKCSVCKQSLTEDGLCEHEKGSTTDKGDKVYWIIDAISYRENSFVNSPADPYSRIVSIDIGQGFIPYQEFLDHRDTLISELIMEDSMKNAKLDAAARNKLPDSAFCGPDNSFPAHDEIHVKAGLALLEKEKFEDSTKTKIKASLYRKGKRYGVLPSDDELKEVPNLTTYRIDEDFSDEEVTQIKDFFAASPDSDLPEVEDTQVEDQEPDPIEPELSFEDIQKKTKKEVIAFTEKTISDHTAALEAKDTELATLNTSIVDLNATITDNESILNSKEDEINKLLDDHAKSELAYKDAIVENILDLKVLEDEKESREELKEKYIVRQIDSLVDTINDLRKEVKIEDNSERVVDPTLTNTDNGNDTKDDLQDEIIIPEGVPERFRSFYK